jgi:hypothetical protein
VNGSKIRTGALRSVFNSGLNRDFDAHLAQLSVLYEDLRIELFSMFGPRVKDVDVLETLDEDLTQISKYRRHYFLRRSFASIREFAECLKHLRKTPEFIAIRNAATRQNADVLNDALRFFSKHSEVLRTVRNNTGAHFGVETARYAVEHLDPGSVSRIELAVSVRKVDAKLHYAGELAATAFAKGVPGNTSSERIKNAIRIVAEAHGHAASFTRVMLSEYLFDRFK